MDVPEAHRVPFPLTSKSSPVRWLDPERQVLFKLPFPAGRENRGRQCVLEHRDCDLLPSLTFSCHVRKLRLSASGWILRCMVTWPLPEVSAHSVGGGGRPRGLGHVSVCVLFRLLWGA